MYPATAIARFATMGGDTVIDLAFAEFIWWSKTLDSGHRLIECHVEMDTQQFPRNGTPILAPAGQFIKGSASGAFLIDFGPNLPPHSQQWWWPAGATQSVQPPMQDGQGNWGEFSDSDGWAANTHTAGFTYLSPYTIPDVPNNGMMMAFKMGGPGKQRTILAAKHFINSGDLSFYFTAKYIVPPLAP